MIERGIKGCEATVVHGAHTWIFDPEDGEGVEVVRCLGHNQVEHITVTSYVIHEDDPKAREKCADCRWMATLRGIALMPDTFGL